MEPALAETLGRWASAICWPRFKRSCVLTCPSARSGAKRCSPGVLEWKKINK